MDTPPSEARPNVPATLDLYSLRHLEALLGRSRAELEELAKHAVRYYKPFLLKKRERPFAQNSAPAKKRLIDNPIDPLKAVQSRIEERLLKRLILPKHLLGGVRGKSIPDNAKLHLGAKCLVQLTSNEAEHRDPKRKKQWVALVDGNRTQIDYLHQLADERKLDLIIVVDFIHVAQYVWQASLALLPGNQAGQDRWVRAHLLEILRGKASVVAAGIRRSATLRAWPLPSGRRLTTVPITSLITRRICSTTRRWLRACPSLRVSLKVPVVIWLRTG